MVVQDQWYTYDNGATSLIFKVWNLAYDGLLNFQGMELGDRWVTNIF